MSTPTPTREDALRALDRWAGFAGVKAGLCSPLISEFEATIRHVLASINNSAEGGDPHGDPVSAHVAPGASATQEAGAPEAYKWPQVTMEYCDDESGRYWVSHLVGTSILSDGETREEAFAHLLEAIVDTVQALCEWSAPAPTLTPEEAKRLAGMCAAEARICEPGGEPGMLDPNEAADWRRIEEIMRAAGRQG